MTFIKKIALAASLTAAIFASEQASAQYRLPASHNQQHNALIADQRPAGIDIQSAKINSNIANDVRQREMLQDNELFNYNFNSQSVNAYAGLDVPATHNIDVTGFVAPVRGKLTSPYGWRARFGRMHRGVDLNLRVGDSVVSAFDGKVRLVKYEAAGYGNYIVVRHDNGLETVYGHLSRTLVKPGQRVRAGQLIAKGGNTGRSTGPHLHFETRFMGLPVNPEAIIDFENHVTHKDVFTFDKKSYERAQVYGPKRKAASATAKTTTSKKKKAALTASAKTKKSARKTSASKKSNRKRK